MADMFSSATAYERYMGRWSAQVAPLFASFVNLPDAGRVLDVGCGTGSMIEAVERRGRRVKITGVDTARPFLNYARARFPSQRCSFTRGSAAQLPYPDAGFDLCLCLLVFQLIPQVETAAAEMRRVTRPGGTVAACAWEGQRLEMVAVLREEARRLGLESAPPGKGRARWGEGELAALWRKTGLAEVEAVALDIRTEFRSFDDYWLPLLAGVGPTGAFVAGLNPEQRAALREALYRRLPDGPISLGARAWAVRGTVPS